MTDFTPSDLGVIEAALLAYAERPYPQFHPDSVRRIIEKVRAAAEAAERPEPCCSTPTLGGRNHRATFHSDDRRYREPDRVAEASDFGLAPGVWPNVLWEGSTCWQRVTEPSGTAVRYVDGAGVILDVLND